MSKKINCFYGNSILGGGIFKTQLHLKEVNKRRLERLLSR